MPDRHPHSLCQAIHIEGVVALKLSRTLYFCQGFVTTSSLGRLCFYKDVRKKSLSTLHVLEWL